MLSYDLSKRGNLPRYEYLYRCIRDDIVNGVIAADDRLPSKRALAQALGVGLITVENAYAQLVAEGYVVARERRGYYVAELPKLPSLLNGATSVPRSVSAALSSRPGSDALMPSETLTSSTVGASSGSQDLEDDLSADSETWGARRGVLVAPETRVLADFSRPATPNRSPAAALWGRALRDALAHEPEGELFGPQPSQGSVRLREAICHYLAETRGMAVDPSRIVIGAGAQLLYVLIAQLLRSMAPDFVGDGAWRPTHCSSFARLPPTFAADEDATICIALEDPGYPRLARIYETCGIYPCFIPLDHEGIDMATLRQSGANVVHVMPSHQFPTGRVTSIARRYELLGWAAQQPNRFIVEDDYDREFRLAGMPIPPLQSIDADGRVIYVNTFSKSLSSALRMAYMILPERLAAHFSSDLGFYTNTVSVVDQVTLARLLESGEYERHVGRYRKRQRDVRDALIDAIRESELARVATIEEADSGLHFVLALDVAVSEEEIAAAAARDGVMLAPLGRYLEDQANDRRDDRRRRFVMQYEGLDVSLLPEVMRILERAALLHAD